MGSNSRRLSLALVLAVAGCSMKDAKETAGVAAAPNVVNIVATEYAFESPDSIPAGLTTLKLTDSGKELHHASLIRLDSGKTIADLEAALKLMKPGSHPPGWLIPAGGPNAASPGASSELTVALNAGNYAIVCWIPDAKGVPHIMSGMARGLTVTPNPTANMVEPASDITVMMKDYQFDFSAPLTAGKHTLRLQTAPGQPHEFTFFQLAPGKTANDIVKYVETGMQGPPPATPLGGVAGVAAGRPSFYAVDLKPGDYAIVCFLEDAKDGKPHYTHGMIQQIKVI